MLKHGCFILFLRKNIDVRYNNRIKVTSHELREDDRIRFNLETLSNWRESTALRSPACMCVCEYGLNGTYYCSAMCAGFLDSFLSVSVGRLHHYLLYMRTPTDIAIRGIKRATCVAQGLDHCSTWAPHFTNLEKRLDPCVARTKRLGL